GDDNKHNYSQKQGVNEASWGDAWSKQGDDCSHDHDQFMQSQERIENCSERVSDYIFNI
ncbi:hypothetical protein BG011_000995, partial [Mortierella polycephala]